MSSQSFRRGRKRKSTDVSVEQSPKRNPEMCILHSTTECGKFTVFNNVADVSQILRKLHDIGNLRMATPSLSVHRMEDICSQIPDSLKNYDLATTGYHRRCYKRFTTGTLQIQLQY